MSIITHVERRSYPLLALQTRVGRAAYKEHPVINTDPMPRMLMRPRFYLVSAGAVFFTFTGIAVKENALPYTAALVKSCGVLNRCGG